MSSPPRPAVLFDVDGTLVDSSYLHTVAWWQAFHDVGRTVPMAEIHRRIGMGGSHLIEGLLGEPDDHADTAHTHRFAPYLEQVDAFDGAVDLLRATAGLGLAVVIASSASEDEGATLKRVLAGAEDVWTDFTTSADASGGKPDPDILQVACERAGSSPELAVMVGDAIWDVEAARRIGMPCVGLGCGGVTEAELREAGAIATYADPRALLAGLEDSPLGALARGETLPKP